MEERRTPKTKKRQKRERRRRKGPPNGEKGGSLPPSPVDVGKTFQDDDDSDDDSDDAEVFEDAQNGTDDPTKVFDFFVDENDENVRPFNKNDFETKNTTTREEDKEDKEEDKVGFGGGALNRALRNELYRLTKSRDETSRPDNTTA